MRGTCDTKVLHERPVNNSTVMQERLGEHSTVVYERIHTSLTVCSIGETSCDVSGSSYKALNVLSTSSCRSSSTKRPDVATMSS